MLNGSRDLRDRLTCFALQLDSEDPRLTLRFFSFPSCIISASPTMLRPPRHDLLPPCPPPAYPPTPVRTSSRPVQTTRPRNRRIEPDMAAPEEPSITANLSRLLSTLGPETSSVLSRTHPPPLSQSNPVVIPTARRLPHLCSNKGHASRRIARLPQPPQQPLRERTHLLPPPLLHLAVHYQYHPRPPSPSPMSPLVLLLQNSSDAALQTRTPLPHQSTRRSARSPRSPS